MTQFTVVAILTACLLWQTSTAARLRYGNWREGGLLNHGMLSYFEHLEASGVKVPADQYMKQTLDHFNAQDYRTFLQRFQVNTTFWKSGGPILLLLGGEGPASPMWLAADTAIMDDAQNLGAMVAQIEHRYYGKSQPFNDLSTANLQYLSSRQALADIAAFIPYLKGLYSAESSKVVVFGGSYSGALSAWFRTKYPQHVVGSIATSAPVLAQTDFSEYHEVVTQSMMTSTYGEACATNIGAAMATVDSMMTAAATKSQLVKDFQTCSSDLEDPKDVANFLASLAGNFDGVVQYNRDNRNFEGGAAPPTITDLCSIMTNASLASPYERLVAVNKFMLGEDCFDVSYNEMIAELANSSLAGPAAGGGRQWIYQTCTEFGYYQTSDSNNQAFGKGFPIDFSLQQCVDIYHITGYPGAPNVNATNDFYGGKQIAGSRIIFPNGSIDPWHALGIVQDVDATKETIAIYINGTAHCANMYPPSADDVPGLTAARTTISQKLQEWLQ